MATLIVYPDAADVTVREENQINEPTFKDYLDRHISGWDKGPTGHQLKTPRFVAEINGQMFNPKEWGNRVLLDSDTIDVVLPPQFSDSYFMVGGSDIGTQCGLLSLCHEPT